MQPPDDSDLLRQYTQQGSEAAFAALVTRHVNLVYSVALRRVGHPQNAQEITQAVFLILAQKAAQLRHDKALSSWLFQVTRLTASNFVRSESRRHHREQETHMQSLARESAHDPWPEIAPFLDDAVARLRDRDRRAIVLRFYEGRNLREVGLALGASEDAAEKRVNRALEKLRKFFIQRGVISTTTLIAGTLSAHSIQAAPVTLAAAATASALAQGATASASTLTLLKATLKLMAWSKTKTAIGAGVVVILTAATTTLVIKTWEAKKIYFEAEGTIVYSVEMQGSSYKDTRHFIVTRGGDQWKIRTIDLHQESSIQGAPPAQSIDLFEEMGYDGTNIYTLEQYDKEKVKSIIPKLLETPNYILALGRVEAAASPPCMEPNLAPAVWLAYCSAPYLNELKDGKVVSPLFAASDFLTESIPRMLLPAKWAMNDSSFVREISWYSDGKYPVSQPNQKLGNKLAYEKFAPPYDKDFLEGHFQNLTWTNFSGMSLPGSFQLIFYGPSYADAPGAKPTFNVPWTITGNLETIRKVERFSPVPELTARTGITDWRTMRGGRPSEYVSTNRWDYAAAVR